VLPVVFEPTISAGERPQTYTLNRAVTGTEVLIFKFRYTFQQHTSISVTNISFGLWFHIVRLLLIN